jgi:hypothetical protein
MVIMKIRTLGGGGLAGAVGERRRMGRRARGEGGCGKTYEFLVKKTPSR